jgi:hypothetical protein
MATQKFPHGWDEERVKHLIEHHESMTEEEQIVEDGNALQWQEGQGIGTNREILDLIERSRTRTRTEGAISSEEMRARFE